MYFGDSQPVAEPKTHVLVVGVGGYRHLLGGAEPHLDVVRELGLGSLPQLTSPPCSALAFAEWIRGSRHDHWKAPLGSIDLVVSTAPGQSLPGLPADTPAATIKSLEQAYDAWRARCDAHAANVGIFFFGGHGVEKANHYLLTEDFAAERNRPWEGSFNVDLTRDAFRGCQASTQCFFVDACREVTPRMLAEISIDSKSLDRGSLLASNSHSSHWLTIKATAHGQRSFGPQGETSYFTRALIRGLEGATSRQQGGRWLVETGLLSTYTHDLLDVEEGKANPDERCVSLHGTNTHLYAHDDPPEVRLELDWLPEKASVGAQLSYRDIAHGTGGTPVPPPAPSVLKLRAGPYRLEAKWRDGAFTTPPDVVIVYPPTTIHPIRCQP